MKRPEVEDLVGANRFDMLTKYRVHIVTGILFSVGVVYAIKKLTAKKK